MGRKMAVGRLKSKWKYEGRGGEVSNRKSAVDLVSRGEESCVYRYRYVCILYILGRINGRRVESQNGHERLPEHLVLPTRHTKSISLPDTSAHTYTHRQGNRAVCTQDFPFLYAKWHKLNLGKEREHTWYQHRMENWYFTSFSPLVLRPGQSFFV